MSYKYDCLSHCVGEPSASLTTKDDRKEVQTMKYRPQRGGYDESMAEVVEVNSLADIEKEMRREYPHLSYGIPLNMRPYGHDRRNGWDTWVVLLYGEAVGFTNGKLCEF